MNTDMSQTFLDQSNQRSSVADLRVMSAAIESALRNILDCDCDFCDARTVIRENANKILAAWERQLVLVASPSGEESVALPRTEVPDGAGASEWTSRGRGDGETRRRGDGGGNPNVREGATKSAISREAVHALRMLARSREPIQGAEFQRVLSIDERSVKALMRELRDEWLLPVCGTRQRPFGYFIAATTEQFLEWMRTTRSQAISELATAHRLFKTNFPELAGQGSFDFIQTVSTELQEAIR